MRGGAAQDQATGPFRCATSVPELAVATGHQRSLTEVADRGWLGSGRLRRHLGRPPKQ
jgi:hypothetical protein